MIPSLHLITSRGNDFSYSSSIFQSLLRFRQFDLFEPVGHQYRDLFPLNFFSMVLLLVLHTSGRELLTLLKECGDVVALVGGSKSSGKSPHPNVALLYLARILLGNKGADRLIFQKLYVFERTKLPR